MKNLYAIENAMEYANQFSRYSRWAFLTKERGETLDAFEFSRKALVAECLEDLWNSIARANSPAIDSMEIYDDSEVFGTTFYGEVEEDEIEE